MDFGVSAQRSLRLDVLFNGLDEINSKKFQWTRKFQCPDELDETGLEIEIQCLDELDAVPCTWLNGRNFQDLMNSVDLTDLAKFNTSTKLIIQ